MTSFNDIPDPRISAIINKYKGPINVKPEYKRGVECPICGHQKQQNEIYAHTLECMDAQQEKLDRLMAFELSEVTIQKSPLMSLQIPSISSGIEPYCPDYSKM